MTERDPKTRRVSTGKPRPGASESSQDRTPQEPEAVPEIGGRKGPDPTRYGDWEKDGRCIDF